MKTRFFILLVLASFSMSSATIINVPGDSATIQGGINGSGNGDTVLVQPGTYVENINFNGHNIVLGSLFLTTGDTSYISQTVIDGDSAGSAVTFESGENSTAVITGFSLHGGFRAYDGGGGIYCSNGSSPCIIANLINENTAFYGGGIYCGGSSNPTIQFNSIMENHALDHGGGIYCVGNSNPGIVENGIINNSGLGGGGISCFSSSPAIYNNNISENSVMDPGGGIYCANSSPNIGHNIISDNYSGDLGSGICCVNSSPTIENNIISGNLISGGINCIDNSNPLIINNTLSGNYESGRGGGIKSEDSDPVIANTIFWADSSSIGGDEIYIISGSPSITYCDIQDTLWPGEGNISCDPQFCEPDSGNFDLNAFSCCVGTGHNGEDIGARGIGCWNCEGYVVGDINNSGGYNGLDVTYGVAYLKGGPPPPYECVCTPGNIWYASGDVNASCSYNGLDITYGVSFLKGIYTELLPCPDCPPVR